MNKDQPRRRTILNDIGFGFWIMLQQRMVSNPLGCLPLDTRRAGGAIIKLSPSIFSMILTAVAGEVARSSLLREPSSQALKIHKISIYHISYMY